MAFRITPAAKTLAPALGALVWTQLDGQTAGFGHVHTAAGLLTTDNEDHPMFLYTRSDIRSTYRAVISGRASTEICRRMPKEWTSKDFSMVTDLIGECVETVLRSDAMRLTPSVEGIADAYMQEGMNARITRIFNPLMSSMPAHADLSLDDWNRIVRDHKCSICQDVLAAPVIIDCTHNFCGSCLLTYTKTPPCAQGKAIHFCPECRVEIESNGIYERALDEMITKKVEGLPSGSEQILDWKKRRNEYLRLMKANQLPSLTGPESESFEHRFTDAEDFIKWAVFFVAAVTVGVLVNRHMTSQKRWTSSA